MKTDVLRAVSQVQRLFGLAFSTSVELDPDIDDRGLDHPRDPYAKSCVRNRPRPPLLSGGVALLEPEDDTWTVPVPSRRR
jgi:hypothetical protein